MIPDHQIRRITRPPIHVTSPTLRKYSHIRTNVNLGKNGAEKPHQNNIKASVECHSTNMIGDDGITRRYDASREELVTNTRDTYADVVRTSSCKEIVRRKMNIELASPEGQSLGKPLGRSFAKLIKI